jgi:hypothetical protein
LQWHKPQRETLRRLLRHPAYAGIYTWGRRAVDPARARPGRRGSGRTERAPRDCAVYLPDNHPAYISFDQYQNNLRRIERHRSRGPTPGPSRETVALLAGLVVCGRCGCRLQTRYTRTLRYQCQRRALDYAEPPCGGFNGEPLERFVCEQIFQVMTPSALELSLHAVEHCAQRRAALDQHWRLRLERARQDAARAFRQYDAVEPEDRLVARTLERRWEEALLAQRGLEEEYDRFVQEQPVPLGAAERAQIEALARDLPAIWHSERTTVAERRQVVRLLLDRVVVWASATSQALKVQLHWSGGTVTAHEITRAVRSWGQMAEADAIREYVHRGEALGWPARRLAEELNGAGYRTPRGRPFTAEGVRQLRSRGGPARPRRDERTAGPESDPSGAGAPAP